MMGNALFLLITLSAAAFVDYRLWWSIRNRTIQVKGWTFKADDEPGRYWAHLILNLVAALMLSALAALLIVAIIVGS